MPGIFYGVWGIIGVFSCVYLFLLFRKKQPYRYLSAVLRISILLAVLFLIHTYPVSFSFQTAPLFVLIDTSRSMRSLLEVTQSEPLEDIEKILPSSVTETIGFHYSQHNIHYYNLFDSGRRYDSKSSHSSNWSSQSPILNKLKEFIAVTDLPQGSQILLISDGQDTTSETISEQTARLLRYTGVTVNTLLLINDKKQNDTGLDQIQNPRVIFTNTLTHMPVSISSHLDSFQETHLVLTDGQSILDKKNVTLPSGSSKQQFMLSWNPQKTGNTLLYLRLLPVEGETNIYNNIAYLPVNVRNQKFRVLHIAGRPSWDVRHLRSLLKEIPELDMISFYILRDPYIDVQSVPESELALIQFPVKVLFQVELFKFDAVIFHNFAIQKYLRNREFQSSFQKYLANGRRIIVIGGDQVEEHLRYQQLFLPMTKQKFHLKFQHSSQWTFKEKDRFLSTHLRRQSTFQALNEEQDSPSQLLARSSYQRGRVDWVLDSATWRWKYPANRQSIGQNGSFATFWQMLLYQSNYERSQIFHQFRKNRPYHVEDTIEGVVYLPSADPKKMFFNLSDQLLNETILDEPLAVSQQQAYITLSSLPASIYEMRLSCRCSSMSDVTQTLTVVDEWLEFNKTGTNRSWLEELTKITHGKSIIVHL